MRDKLTEILRITRYIDMNLYVPAMLSFVITSSFYKRLFEPEEIISFPYRTIGTSVLRNYDVAERVTNYIELFIIFAIFQFILSVVLNIFLKKYFQRDNKIITRIVEVLSITTIISMISGDVTLRFPVFILEGVLIGILFSWILEQFLFSKVKRLRDDPLQNDNKSIFFLTSINIALFLQFFIFRFIEINKEFLIIAFTVWVSLIILSGFSKKKDAFIHGIIPMNLLGIVPLLSNEIQYTLSGRIPDPFHVYVLLGAILLLTSVVLSRINLGKANRKGLLVNILIPIGIATLAAYNFYQHYIIVNGIPDLFHPGETNLPIQQLLNFGKVPFLEIFPTHGLSSFIPQFFFSLINGFYPLEGIIWSRFMYIIFVLLFYFLFVKGFRVSALTATLFSVFLPINFIYDLYFGVLVLFFLTIGHTFKSDPLSNKSIALTSLVLIFTLLWRIDFGIAAILTTVFLYGGYLFGKSKLFDKYTVGFYLKIALVFTLGMLVLLVNENSREILKTVFVFTTFQNNSMGLVEFSSGSSLRDTLQYFVFPLISIFYIVNFSLKTLVHKKCTRIEYILTGIAVFSLIISTRSLQRHSLVEGVFYNYLFILLFATLPLLLLQGKNVLKYKLFRYAILLLCVLAFLLPTGDKTYNIINFNLYQRSNSINLVNTIGRFEFNNWEPLERRVIIEGSSENYNDIVVFLKANLKGEQTFYDLSNATMLYILADKSFPTYLVPSIYHTSDIIQEGVIQDLQSLMLNDKLPFIIFKQGSGWDSVDYVDSEVRSYKIAEFIYTNYEPYQLVGSYQIWRNKDDIPANDGVHADQKLKIGYLPYVWANYDEQAITDVMLSSNSEVLSIPDNYSIDKGKGNYIEFLIDPTEEREARVHINDNDNSYIEFKVRKSTQPLKYLIRISMLYDWYGDVEKVKIVGIESNSVQQINLKYGD